MGWTWDLVLPFIGPCFLPHPLPFHLFLPSLRAFIYLYSFTTLCLVYTPLRLFGSLVHTFGSLQVDLVCPFGSHTPHPSLGCPLPLGLVVCPHTFFACAHLAPGPHTPLDTCTPCSLVWDPHTPHTHTHTHTLFVHMDICLWDLVGHTHFTHTLPLVTFQPHT